MDGRSCSINQWDWSLKLQLTDFLLKELKPHFPAHLKDLPSSMFVGNLHELIMNRVRQKNDSVYQFAAQEGLLEQHEKGH